MLTSHELDRPTLSDLYDRLELFTNWWFEYRDTDQDGVPNYIQGCDSGWDNSTVFDPGICPESPDLSAYLILQMETLAEIARRLGRNKIAHWQERARALLEKLLAHCWRTNQFVAPVSRTHAYDAAPTSLLLLMPLLLGDRLGKGRCLQLAERVKRHFLTEHGAATEMPASPKYQSDGYWRGPIWAPSTYLLVDGLRAGGQGELARCIADRFCNMVALSAGHYENYDALTGQGLRDQGYTWTASVNLLLLSETKRG
jgi:glycogen debranching enzyme